MQHARAAASPALSASEHILDEPVLEWTLGRISLPPTSPQALELLDSGEELRLEDLHSTSLRSSKAALNATSAASTKKQDDEAERVRLEALKAHVPACLSNVLAVAPAAVTACMSSLSLQNSNLIIIPHCLSHFPALSKLDLSCNRLESVDSAFVLNHLPRLQNLNLSNNRIHNMAQIQELGQHSCLTALELSNNPLQNCGQRVLLLQALIFSNPLKPLADMNNCDLSAITCGGKSASFSNILSSERPGSIIIKGIHPSKDRPSTAKAHFSKPIIYADMNLAAVPRPCAFPHLQFLNGSALTVDIFDLAAISELEMLSARQSNLRTELPKRRSARAEQVKEKWLEFDPDVKDIQAQQARGTSYEKQLPLLLQRTGSRFTKYAQRDLNRRVKHFIQSGDLGFTLYDSGNESEDEAGGIRPLQGAAALKTDSIENRELLDDLGTVQWTRRTVRSTSPNAFGDSAFHDFVKETSAAAAPGEQQSDSKEALLADQDELLNFSVSHKASATISSILARVNASIRAKGRNTAERHDHAKSGLLPVAVDLNDDAQAVLKSNIDVKAASVAMFPPDEQCVALSATNQDHDTARAPQPDTVQSQSSSPATSPRGKGLKSKGKPKSVNPNALLHSVKAPTDERNVWVYESALQSMDLAAAALEAASLRDAALSGKLVDGSARDDDTTVITVRLPDRESMAFKAMRSTTLDQVHAAAATAFGIESEFVFSTPYPRKLLLQQNLSLDELGLIPQGLLLVIFSDERDTVRKSDQGAVGSKVVLGNILEMELKEQQSITKSVHSHILSRHHKVANLIGDASASLAKNKPATSSHVGGDEISAALTAVDGLFLKTNVELQTISNSSRTELPMEAMKKMVRIEAAQEQRQLDREHEKQQYQHHVKRLDSIYCGASRSAVHRASVALLYKAEHSGATGGNKCAAAADDAVHARNANCLSPRKKNGAAAANVGASGGATRAVLGFNHYRSAMETVEDIQRKSSGIVREKYIDTLMGCIDARHAAKTEPKLLSRYLDRFVDQELKYEDDRRAAGSNLDFMIESHSYGRTSDVAIDSSGKRIEYPERLRAAAAADDVTRHKVLAASRRPVHARLPPAVLALPSKESSRRRIEFKRSA